ncbi:hypothetical protein AC1031_012376 [Aphanomyces cochlioides]|nr:hypothetical protein AC1031_012376 [Aphanomyces cochlioides]
MYVITPSAIVKTDPVIDLLSCLSFAKSASLNAFGLALARPSYLCQDASSLAVVIVR